MPIQFPTRLEGIETRKLLRCNQIVIGFRPALRGLKPGTTWSSILDGRFPTRLEGIETAITGLAKFFVCGFPTRLEGIET